MACEESHVFTGMECFLHVYSSVHEVANVWTQGGGLTCYIRWTSEPELSVQSRNYDRHSMEKPRQFPPPPAPIPAWQHSRVQH